MKQIPKEIYSVEKDIKILHPITCTLLKSTTSDNICMTKYQNIDDEFNFVGTNVCKDTNTYGKYLYIPPVGISSEVLLNIYKVNSIESLYNFIEENKTNMNILTINRILNSWIIINFNNIINHYPLIEQIVELIIGYYNKSIFFKIKNETIDIKNNIHIFLPKWINKKSKLKYLFKVDLLCDFTNYLLDK
jgi:hypothetical protein